MFATSLTLLESKPSISPIWFKRLSTSVTKPVFTHPFFERRDLCSECIQFGLVSLLLGPVILIQRWLSSSDQTTQRNWSTHGIICLARVLDLQSIYFTPELRNFPLLLCQPLQQPADHLPEHPVNQSRSQRVREESTCIISRLGTWAGFRFRRRRRCRC